MCDDLGTRTVANANLQGPAANMISSFKALFTRGEGNPGARVTLALAPFFFFTRGVYKAGRVTLPAL